MKCPSCGIEVFDEFLNNRTHFYSCSECPIIMFEYLSKQNTDDVSQRLDPIINNK